MSEPHCFKSKTKHMAPSPGEIVSLPNIPQADIDVTDLKAKSTGLIILFS